MSLLLRVRGIEVAGRTRDRWQEVPRALCVGVECVREVAKEFTAALDVEAAAQLRLGCVVSEKTT